MSEQVRKAYCDGYDFGFTHPNVKTNKASKKIPAMFRDNTEAWLDGFKDGKTESGIYSIRNRRY